MIISGRRIGVEGGHRPGHRIEMILPHQFVGKREGVAFKLESADGLLGRRHHVYRVARAFFSAGSPALAMPARVSSADSTLVSAMKAETAA